MFCLTVPERMKSETHVALSALFGHEHRLYFHEETYCCLDWHGHSYGDVMSGVRVSEGDQIWNRAVMHAGRRRRKTRRGEKWMIEV